VSVGHESITAETQRPLRTRREKRLNMPKNMARNLVYYAQLLKQYPLTMKR
jgi:hypothetical protein